MGAGFDGDGGPPARLPLSCSGSGWRQACTSRR